MANIDLYIYQYLQLIGCFFVLGVLPVSKISFAILPISSKLFVLLLSFGFAAVFYGICFFSNSIFNNACFFCNLSYIRLLYSSSPVFAFKFIGVVQHLYATSSSFFFACEFWNILDYLSGFLLASSMMTYYINNLRCLYIICF